MVADSKKTNILDTALLRPGRFDRIVQEELPDKAGSLHILHIHAATKPLAADVCLEQIDAETQVFSGDNLENLLNEAAITALRDGRQEITQADLRVAV